MINKRLVDALNSKFQWVRLSALKKIAKTQEFDSVQKTFDTALQIHTYHSFSQFSPSLSAYVAHKFGLRVAGNMDNYTFKGAKEFIKASRILGLTYSIGTKFRLNFNEADVKLANVAVMGVAVRFIDQIQGALEKYRKRQIENVKLTVEAINKRFKKFNVQIDFEKDVAKTVKNGKEGVYLSKIAYLALARKLLKIYDPQKIIETLASLNINLTPEQRELLTMEVNVYRDFDLCKALFEFRSNFFAKKEYLQSDEVVENFHKFGAICAFELQIDKLLEYSEDNKKRILTLLESVKKQRFDGVGFDPNMVDDQLRNYLFDKLEEFELLPFLLYEIEFPRQSFAFSYPCARSKELMERSAYVVVGSEMSENQTCEGFISSNLKTNGFAEKVALFEKIGRGE